MMLIEIWDFFFTRRIWTVIEARDLRHPWGGTGRRYILQDQFGNIKMKDCI